MKLIIMSTPLFTIQRKFTVLVICLHGFMAINSSAQEIKIGNTIPDITINHVMNYSSSSIRLSEFRGKLLLLDFWGHGCHACVSGFPEMDSLQKKFNGKIQIILVNRESRDSTDKWFGRHKGIQKPTLPLITGDKVLHSYFPHETVPHYVWIDQQSKVVYITDAQAVTEKKIGDFLNGIKLKLSEKLSYTNFNDDTVLTADGNGRWLNSLKYNSSLYQCRVSGTQQINLKENTHIRFYKNLVELVRLAVIEGDEQKYYLKSRNNIVLQVADTSEYLAPHDPDKNYEFEMNHGYIYELLVPPEKAGQKYKFMQEDLKRYFDINFFVGKREIPCWVLTRISTTDKMASKGKMSDSLYSKIWGNDSNVIYNNVPVSEFVSGLNYIFSGHRIASPVVDGTGYQGKIDLIINKKSLVPFDLDAIRNELRKYGLDLLHKNWLTHVLVIRENNYKIK